MKETIEIDDYKVVIAQDDSPLNPFEEWDCEPPLLTYYESLRTYGDVPDISNLVGMIPDEFFARGNRVKLIRESLNCSLKEFAESRRDYGRTFRDQFAEECAEIAPVPSWRSWRSATDYFEMMEWLCKLAGVPCHYMQSNGYSQGHSALVMAVATPDWVKTVGASAETLSAQCKGACDLYGYWAWGDVYGVSEIIAPDGSEVKDASVWGFYGPHKTSGLLEHAKDMIEFHKKECVKEAAEAFEMACRDIVTV